MPCRILLRIAGVLLASGYIAGGAIAGIIIAFLAGGLPHIDGAITKWAETYNPFYAGPKADGLSLLAFIALTCVLYLTGRGGPRRKRVTGKD